VRETHERLQSAGMRAMSVQVGDRGESPSPEHAAAAIGAVRRFLAETARAHAAVAPEQCSGWLRAARLEAVGLDEG
jgi:hypothetical protein